MLQTRQRSRTITRERRSTKRRRAQIKLKEG